MQRKEKEVICYCLGYTRGDIRLDVIRHGRSLIRERIMALFGTGVCICSTSNPKGR